MTDMDKLIAQDADLIDPIQDRLVLAVRSLATDDTQEVAEAFAEALRKGLAAQGLAVTKADRIEALNAEVARLRVEAPTHVQALQELCWVEIPEEKAALEAAIDFLWRVAGHD